MKLVYSQATLLASVVSLGACSLDQFRHDPPAPPNPALSCQWQAMIEDCEDRNDQILVRQGRGGYTYTYLDTLGSTIEPPESNFRMERGGANSKYAIHIHGKVANAGEEVYAGLGMDFRNPR